MNVRSTTTPQHPHVHTMRELKKGTRPRLGACDRDVVAPSMRGSCRVVKCGSCPAFRGVVESVHNADGCQHFTDVFSTGTASPIARWPYSVGVMYPPEC